MPNNIISVLNQKGGVGKTTTVCNLGHGLARAGLKTLLIDIDPQANLTSYLIGPQNITGIESCLLDRKSAQKVVIETGRPNLQLIPSSINLTKTKSMLESDKIEGHTALKTCLSQIKNNFDIILIDNPADFDLLTINSLIASTHYLVAVSPEFLPMQGVKLIMNTVAKVEKHLKKTPLIFIGCVPTIVDMRLAIVKESLEVLGNIFKNKLLPMIRSNTRIKEGPAHKETVFEYEDNRGSKDFEELTQEFKKRMGF